MEGLKYFGSFLGMLLVVYMTGVISSAILYFPPILPPEFVTMRAIYFWFGVEWFVYISMIGSSALFIALRACFRHKI
jgi:hypothetical protein